MARRRHVAPLAGLALVMAAMAACGEEPGEPAAARDEPASDWHAGAGPEWEQVLAAGREEGQVVLDSSPELSQSSFADDFERDTDIELVGTTGESVARYIAMEQEAAANRLSIDVALGGGAEFPMRDAGMLREIKPQLMLPSVTEPENWIGGEPKWMDADGTYMLQLSNYVYGWIVVNEDTFDLDSFTSWEDLLDSGYRGRIASYDATKGPGHATSAFFYDALGEEFVKELYVDQDVTFTTDRRQLVEWIARGTYDIALGATQAEVERFKAEGVNVTGLMPDEGVGQLTGGSSVLKQPQNADGTPGPHPNAATVFINWFASQAGQQSYGAAMNEISTRADVDVPTVPDYVRPEDDREYIDTYAEQWYTKVRPQISAKLADLLG